MFVNAKLEEKARTADRIPLIVGVPADRLTRLAMLGAVIRLHEALGNQLFSSKNQQNK